MFSKLFEPNIRRLELKNIGTITIERSRKAKHLNIRIHPRHGIRVSLPWGVPLQIAESFVLSKSRWIEKHLKLMEQRKAEQGYTPEKSEPVHIDRKKARHVLIQRLHELADRHGFRFNRIFIRNQKSRWGSCSAKNNINLNYKLMILPEKLRDYVILHELVHTRIKNHSPKFWEVLSTYVPDPKLRSKELRKAGAGVL